MKNRLFIEPLDADTNERISEILATEVYVREWPIKGGAVANVAEVTERQLVVIINNKDRCCLKYSLYEKPHEEGKLQPISAAVQSGHITVQQILNRRVRKSINKLKSVRGPKVVVGHHVGSTP